MGSQKVHVDKLTRSEISGILVPLAVTVGTLPITLQHLPFSGQSQGFYLQTPTSLCARFFSDQWSLLSPCNRTGQCARELTPHTTGSSSEPLMGESWRISTPAPSPFGCNDSELILPELHPQVTHRVNPLDSTPSSDSFPFPVLLPHFPPTTAQCLLGKKSQIYVISKPQIIL